MKRMTKGARSVFRCVLRNNRRKKRDKRIDEEDDFPSEIVFKEV